MFFSKNLKETLDIFWENGTVCIGGLGINYTDVRILNDIKRASNIFIEMYKLHFTSLYVEFSFKNFSTLDLKDFVSNKWYFSLIWNLPYLIKKT